MTTQTATAWHDRPTAQLGVGFIPGPEWEVGKRRGDRVRYRNKVTGAWDGWITLEPGDRDYVERLPLAQPPTPPEGFNQSMRPEWTDEHNTDNAAARITDPGKPEITVDNIQHEADKHGYGTMTRDELRKLASDRSIPGRGKMNKDELVKALQLDDVAPTNVIAP